MKQRIKFVILAIILVVMILLALFGYDYLTDKYHAPKPMNKDSILSEGQTNMAADFTVTDMEGNTVKLSDSFGKPIIINFWATWCGPCKSELPAFDAAYTEYGDDITFFMVNLTDGYRDTVQSVKDFISDNGYKFPVYFDTEYSGAEAYRVSSIPFTVVIAKNGNVYRSHIGAMDASILNGYITELLESEQ